MKNKSPKTKSKSFNTNKIAKQFQELPHNFKGHNNTMPSMTVPDMTLTVKQLLHNHTRGIHSDVSMNEPMYFDSEIPILDDITDFIAYREELKAREKALKLRIKEDNDKKLAEQEKIIKAAQNSSKSITDTQEVKPKAENL